MLASEVLAEYQELPEFCGSPLTDINQRGNFGNTPLHVACVRGRLDEVEALLAAGAEINATGEMGNTPLHDAAGQGHVEVVKRLLEAGASPSIVNADGKTPRDVATLMKHHVVVALIEMIG